MAETAQDKICVVIGGCGFIGSAVANEAEQQGYITHRIGREQYEAAKGLTCDVLINANGNSKKYLSRRDPILDFELSVQSVARIVQDFPAKKVIHLSTIDVYPVKHDPTLNHEKVEIDQSLLSPYGFNKYLAEQLVSFWSEDWLLFRMGGFVGPGLKKNSIYDLLKGGDLYVHPDSRYQYQDTRIFAKRVFEMIEQDIRNEVINICGDGVVSLREIAAIMPNLDEHKLPENGTAEHYEVNLDKLHQYVQPISSKQAVEQFINEVITQPDLIA